jgi:hypothetical protein
MKKIVTAADAKVLLDEIKALIKLNGLLFMNSRGKNAQYLADLGITPKQQKYIINDLEPDDYVSGPDTDEKYAWKYVAVFGAEYAGTEIYIKFSVGGANEAVICISFPEAESPLVYRFK